MLLVVVAVVDLVGQARGEGVGDSAGMGYVYMNCAFGNYETKEQVWT